MSAADAPGHGRSPIGRQVRPVVSLLVYGLLGPLIGAAVALAVAAMALAAMQALWGLAAAEALDGPLQLVLWAPGLIAGAAYLFGVPPALLAAAAMIVLDRRGGAGRIGAPALAGAMGGLVVCGVLAASALPLLQNSLDGYALMLLASVASSVVCWNMALWLVLRGNPQSAERVGVRP